LKIHEKIDLTANFQFSGTPEPMDALCVLPSYEAMDHKGSEDTSYIRQGYGELSAWCVLGTIRSSWFFPFWVTPFSGKRATAMRETP